MYDARNQERANPQFNMDGMMDQPLVSVVLPTYNCAEYLPETLDSILGQTYTNLEILLVDDGSTDHTAEVIAPYRERVRYFHQENWGGPSRPRNVGVRNAVGELVSFFDSDDVMMPDKIADAVAAFRTQPEIDFLFTNFKGMDEKGSIIREDFLAKYQNFRPLLEFKGSDTLGLIPGRAAYSQLLHANFIGTSSVVCKRRVFDSVGEFDESLLNGDDIDMWRRLAYAGLQFAFLDRIGHGYRQRVGGVTGRGVKRYPAMLKAYRKQRTFELDSEERDFLENRIYNLELEYGNALCAVGQFRESREVYQRALKKKFSWLGIKGLLKIDMERMRAKLKVR